MDKNQYFIDKIDTLPTDLQYAIMYSGWDKSIEGLQKEYKLHIDQGQVLESTAMKLMFGDIDATDFVNTMFTEGHVSTQVSADILLAIDEKILKKIRELLEEYSEMEKRDTEIKKMMMTDEELAADEEAEDYAEYYAETAKKIAENEDKLEEMGINPDGSNATDEQLAQFYGISVEEYKRQKAVESASGALKDSTPDSVIPTDIQKEKADLLKELESPQKSFARPLSPTYQEDHEPLKPDHQIENIHIETPYHEPENVIIEKEPEPVVETKPTAEPISTKIATNLIKKPTKIDMSHDVYREPIE